VRQVLKRSGTLLFAPCQFRFRGDFSHSASRPRATWIDGAITALGALRLQKTDRPSSRLLHVCQRVKSAAKNHEQNSPGYPHIFASPVGQVRGRQGMQGDAMTEVFDVPATVVNFREEARGCVQLAKAETHEAEPFCSAWR
jgi:hypothetical protein